MKKKILILLADVANGHRSAANALTAEFENSYKNKFNIKTIDLFKWAEVEPFNTSDASYSLFTRNSTLLRISNFFFRLFNTEFFYNFFYNYVNKRLYDKTYQLIKDEKPDLVISVHPIVSMVIKEVKLQTNLFKSVTVITDLITLMRGWADTSAEAIFCPATESVNTLVRYGVNVERIVYPLFPIHPDFSNIRSKQEIEKELGITSKKPVILITGGGVGTSTIVEHIREIIQKDEYEVLIVTGKLTALKSELQYEFGSEKNVKNLWIC